MVLGLNIVLESPSHALHKELRYKFPLFLKNNFSARKETFLETSEICAEQQTLFPASIAILVSFIYNPFVCRLANFTSNTNLLALRREEGH
jgi:hypothetical protein